MKSVSALPSQYARVSFQKPIQVTTELLFKFKHLFNSIIYVWIIISEYAFAILRSHSLCNSAKLVIISGKQISKPKFKISFIKLQNSLIIIYSNHCTYKIATQGTCSMCLKLTTPSCTVSAKHPMDCTFTYDSSTSTKYNSFYTFAPILFFQTVRTYRHIYQLSITSDRNTLK